MQRRSLLKLGIVSAAVLGVAGAAWWSWRPALVGARLSPDGRQVASAVAQAVLDRLMPTEPAARAAALERHLSRFDVTLSGLPPHLLAEVTQLLAVLASPPGRRGLAGLAAPWPQASAAEVRAALQDMRTSSLALRQQAYHALRDLTNAAWFSDPEAWVAIGYPGPQDI